MHDRQEHHQDRKSVSWFDWMVHLLTSSLSKTHPACQYPFLSFGRTKNLGT